MSKVEVLVACMHQSDDSLYKEMNLSSDVVLANQCDEYSYREFVQEDNNCVKLVSTFDRGVGKNRNKALMYASGDYLVFSDQDMVYEDDYVKIVNDAFDRCPDADMIVFNLEYLNRFTPPRKDKNKIKRIHIWNSMRYGTARVAIRRTAVEKYCLSFSVLYGGGAQYSSGEDSLFIREAMRKGVRVYLYPRVIAKVKQEESSWFNGYNEKFFEDKGILLANAFPVMWRLLIYYFAFGSRHLSENYSFSDICKLMKKGCKEFKRF